MMSANNIRNKKPFLCWKGLLHKCYMNAGTNMRLLLMKILLQSEKTKYRFLFGRVRGPFSLEKGPRCILS